MARMPSDPIARLPLLEAALAKIGEDALIVNAVELQDVAGMTWRGLKQWIDRDSDFPIVRRGSEGVPWEFDARAVLEHMVAFSRSVAADRERRKARVSRLAGLGGPTSVSPLPEEGRDSIGPGTAAPRELMEDAKALSAMIDVQAKLRAEKVAQGVLINRDKVQTFLWRWLSGLQSNVLAIEARIDKVGKLDAEVRKGLKDELANVLVSFRGELEQQIEKWNESRHR